MHYAILPDEAEPITNQNQLVKSMRFTPLNLDKETPDFVEKLGYLTTSFVFERDQLPLFLRSVEAKLAEALGEKPVEADEEEEEEEADEAEDDVVMIDD